MLTWAQFLLKKMAEIEQQAGRRITNKEFGEIIGFSSGTISFWLSGKNMPDAKSIPVLAEKLGPEVYDVLGMINTDPELRYISNRWDNLPDDIRRQIRELIERYDHEQK